MILSKYTNVLFGIAKLFSFSKVETAYAERKNHDRAEGIKAVTFNSQDIKCRDKGKRSKKTLKLLKTHLQKYNKKFSLKANRSEDLHMPCLKV